MCRWPRTIGGLIAGRAPEGQFLIGVSNGALNKVLRCRQKSWASLSTNNSMWAGDEVKIRRMHNYSSGS